MKIRIGKKLVNTILLLFAFSLLATNIQFVIAANEVTITGTVTIGNATPTAASVEIVNSTYDIVTAWTPNNTDVFGVNATISDSNNLADLFNVSWYIFDDSVHGGDWDSASANGYDLTIITFNESNGLWSIDQGAFTLWTMQNDTGDDCINVGCSTVTSFEFSAQFDISYAAFADTDWNVNVVVYDDQDATSNAASALTFTMNNFFAITIDNSAQVWGTVGALSANNTATTNRTLTITANAQWEARVKADDMTASAEPDVDLDTVNAVVWSDTGTEGTDESLWFRNSYVTALGTWDNQARQPTETNLTRTFHAWFTDTGDFAATKEYTCLMYVLIQANT
ncbi:MAG: hypothetical protein ACXAC2_01835 [Candidatus Kariarchaeaceae archaeon]|jgi:hypothetical protein